MFGYSGFQTIRVATEESSCKTGFMQGTNEGWPAARDWVRADGEIDIDAMDKQFGDACVCATSTPRYRSGAVTYFWDDLTVEVQFLTIEGCSRLRLLEGAIKSTQRPLTDE